MLNTYRELKTKTLPVHCYLAIPQPNHDSLDLNSKAEQLMIDFTKSPPVTAHDMISVSDALELMRANKVRALFIIDYNGEFIGLVSAMDLMGRKPMLYANEAGINRIDVQAKNIMTPKSKIVAINRKELERSTAGDVIQTLNSTKEQYLLVLDDIGEESQVCGLLAASEIKRTLKITLDIPVVANTFYDLERVIHEHKEVM